MARSLRNQAIKLAGHGWAVFPLWGKIPAISKRDGGNGVLDATTDPAQVAAWWRAWPEANIGLAIPHTVLVIDIDPRHDGHLSLAAHEAAHTELPTTMAAYSGRGDGGRHLYFRRPAGRLTSTRLGNGVDLKLSGGYVVAPPSIHPDTGRPYRWDLAPVAAAPGWLVDLLKVNRATAATRRYQPRAFGSLRPVTNGTLASGSAWVDILGPHGWRCLDADGDANGARWLHPDATSGCSATVRHGCLFVYSTNTVFKVTDAGSPHGYTKARASAALGQARDQGAASAAGWWAT